MSRLKVASMDAEKYGKKLPKREISRISTLDKKDDDDDKPLIVNVDLSALTGVIKANTEALTKLSKPEIVVRPEIQIPKTETPLPTIIPNPIKNWHVSVIRDEYGRVTDMYVEESDGQY